MNKYKCKVILDGEDMFEFDDISANSPEDAVNKYIEIYRPSSATKSKPIVLVEGFGSFEVDYDVINIRKV